MIAQHRIVGGMLVERAEAPGKIDLLLRREVLAAKHEDEVVQMRPVHLREDRIVQRPGQVETDDFGAKCI